GDLPTEGPVYVVRESAHNRSLLFVGTEVGVFASLDGGKRWHRLGGGLPTVPVHDLVIHPRDRELVIGTHGRSVYVMDVAPLEALTPSVRKCDMHLFDVRPAAAYEPRKPESATASKSYKPPTPPVGAVVNYYLRSAPDATSILTVRDYAGN